MLACDGIWDCVTSEEGGEQMRAAITKSPQEKLSSHIEELFERICAADILSSSGIGTDNMTCIIIDFDKDLGQHKEYDPKGTMSNYTDVDKKI